MINNSDSSIIKNIISRYGIKGCGLYFAWLVIARNFETDNAILELDQDAKMLSDWLNMSAEEIKEIILYCKKIGLFDTLRETKSSQMKDRSKGDISLSTEVIKEPLPVKPAHVYFVENFIDIYEKNSGYPYKADVKEYVIVHRLIKKFGMDEVINKCRILAEACDSNGLWFTKGWSDFTIGKLSSKWNELLPISKENKWSKLFEEEKIINDRIKQAM